MWFIVICQTRKNCQIEKKSSSSEVLRLFLSMWVKWSQTVPVVREENLENWLYAWNKYFIWSPDPIPSFRRDPPQVSDSSAPLCCLRGGGGCWGRGAGYLSALDCSIPNDWGTGKGPENLGTQPLLPSSLWCRFTYLGVQGFPDLHARKSSSSL